MRVKTLCIIAAVTWLIPIGGCDMGSAERIELLETAIAEVQARSAQADEIIAVLAAGLAESRAALADPNLPPETAAEITALLAAAQEKLATTQAVKSRADAILAMLRTQLAAAGEIAGPGDELAFLGQGLTTVGGQLPPPLGIYATLAGSLVTAIGGAFVAVKRGGALKAKTAEATALDTALAEVVAGGQVFKLALTDNAELMAAFKQAHGDAQSLLTRERVALARVRGTAL